MYDLCVPQFYFSKIICMKKIILLLSVIVFVMVACKKSSTVANIDCSTSKSYATDVSPVFQSSCSYNSSCHGSGSSNGPGALVSYEQIYNNRASIRSAVSSGSMPQGGSLSSSAISAIICWIDAGASDN